MKVYYSSYKLTPIKRANRHSSLDPKNGVYLKGVLGDKVSYADYFPHLPLGDRSSEQFLDEFKFQDVEYDRKVFDFLLRDSSLQKMKPKAFKNHQLWTGSEPLESNVYKYKMLHSSDRAFMQLLEKGYKVRIDTNAMFELEGLKEFWKSIPPELHASIEYCEDPLKSKDWSGSPVTRARDFIEGTPFEYYIYKPNCEFLPKTEAKIVFSSYLGADLGRWHAYCEMIERGDLSLFHGIISIGFCEEENYFFKGSYATEFTADMDKVHEVYQTVYDSDWKLLCSI